VAIQQRLLAHILSLAGQRMVLVGGQALAFWAAYYAVPMPTSAVTKDADFLGVAEDVRRIARGLGGQAHYPHEKALTALAGQVTKALPGRDYVNIDVLHRLHGEVSAQAARARAVKVEADAGQFLVLHPLDVLQGRLENLYSLREKQDEHGAAQLALAIEMTRAFLADEAARAEPEGARRRNALLLKHLKRIAAMARSDAGRKVARRFGLHVADGIAPAVVVGMPTFLAKELPLLRPLMSEGARAAFEA
jgi:hypothetical protein